MMEVVDNGRELFFNTDHHIADGKIILGDKPGFGIDVDFDKLNEIKSRKALNSKTRILPFSEEKVQD